MMKDKVLFMTAYVPHKAAAGEKNTMIMLNDLAAMYDVDLIYYKYDNDGFYMPERENVKVVDVRKNSRWVKIKNILTFPFVHPVFSIRFEWSLLRKIRRLCDQNQYKAIVFNHSNMFLYAKFLHRDIPKLLLCHDVIAQRVNRSSSWLMRRICIASERFGLQVKNSFIFSFSQKDCDLISDIYGLPAKLNLDYIDNAILYKTPTKIEDYYILFGDWTRSENLDGALWYINEVCPSITKDTVIKVIGRAFPNDVVVNNKKVKLAVMGFVDDPYQMLSNCKALIVPLFQGAGIKVKVIEALACGTPVIGTEIAFEGLPEKYSNMMLLANDVDSYLKAMEVEIPVEDRRRIKKDFIADYTSETIPQFLNTILK